MRNLTPARRRTAIICGACAAIIPLTSTLMRGFHSNAIDFAGGMIIGIALVVSIATAVKANRTCA